MSQDESLNGDNGQFASLLEDYEFNPPKRGQVLEGEVLQISEKEVTVDIGLKRDAAVPLDDFAGLDQDRLSALSAGDQVSVYVTRPYAAGGKLLASIRKGLEMEDWQRAISSQRREEVLDLEVTGSNRGGVKVGFGELEGFVPNSHLPTIRRIQDQDLQESRKRALVGTSVCVKVIEVVPERQRLIMSARAANQAQRQRLLEELEIGEIVQGHVVSLVSFGAFVDLGGMDGLVHISELSWDRVEHPSEVVELGQELEVSIKDVDREKGRVSLSRKPLLPNPWDVIVEQYQHGDLVMGVISNVRDFGAFVKLEMGIEGLVHVSEIEIAPGSSIEDIVRRGDKVLAKILSIDPFRERLGLSLRRVSEGEQLVWMEEHEAQEFALPIAGMDGDTKDEYNEIMHGEEGEPEEETQKREMQIEDLQGHR